MGTRKKEYFLVIVLLFASVFNHYVLGLDIYESISILLLLSISFILLIILDRITEYMSKKK